MTATAVVVAHPVLPPEGDPLLGPALFLVGLPVAAVVAGVAGVGVAAPLGLCLGLLVAGLFLPALVLRARRRGVSRFVVDSRGTFVGAPLVVRLWALVMTLASAGVACWGTWSAGRADGLGGDTIIMGGMAVVAVAAVVAAFVGVARPEGVRLTSQGIERIGMLGRTVATPWDSVSQAVLVRHQMALEGKQSWTSPTRLWEARGDVVVAMITLCERQGRCRRGLDDPHAVQALTERVVSGAGSLDRGA